MAHMERSQAIPIGSLVRTLCSPYNLRISLGFLWPRRFEKSHNHQEMFRYAVQGFETFHLSLRPRCMLARESHEKDILEVDILRRRILAKAHLKPLFLHLWVIIHPATRLLSKVSCRMPRIQRTFSWRSTCTRFLAGKNGR